MKKGFTLLEVNLAVFIMATGVLGMCALYSLGFRESRQSVEDVAAAAFADAYLGPLIQGLSATNLTWSAWKKLGDPPSSTESGFDGLWPAGGWLDYMNVSNSKDGTFGVQNGSRAKADGVFKKIIEQVPSEYKGADPGISSDYPYGLVLTRRGAVIQLAFRVARRQGELLTQLPIVSEVHFQGDPDK